jgi:hypothetical protein
MKTEAQQIIKSYDSLNETAIDDEAVDYILAVAEQSAWERDNDTGDGGEEIHDDVAELFSKYEADGDDTPSKLKKTLQSLSKLDLHALYSDLDDLYGDQDDWPERD